MFYNIHKPKGRLSFFVKQIWMIKSKVSSAYSHRIIPNGLIELTFYIGKRANSPTMPMSDNSIIQGQISKYYDLEINNDFDILSISLYPHAVSRMVKIPISELYNSVISLRDLIGDISHIEEKLEATSSFEERVIIAETFIEQLLNIKETENSRRVFEAVSMINYGGDVSIDHIAKRVCLNRKTFEKVFKETIGISPKAFINIVRVQRAIHLKCNDDMNLTELSYHCGYFDQSHMIYDFKKQTGLAPSKFFKGNDVMSDYFN